VNKLRSIPDANPGSVLRGAPASDDLWRAILGDSTRAMLEADERAFLGGASERLDVVDRAHGATLFDRDGREILDFDGEGVHAIGYTHPRVVAAVKRQIETLSSSPAGYTNPPAIAIAQRLAELAPGNLDRVLLTSSDTAAIGAALHLARASTGRHKILAIGEARHRLGAHPAGIEHLPPFDRIGASLGENDRGYERFPDMIDTVLSSSGDFAAVIAEPMAWATVTAPPPDFWRRVRASCDQNGTMLVFDETPSAVGRSGTLFYAEQAGATPDLLAVGQGLGGGVVPVAAVIACEFPLPAAIGNLANDKNPLGAVAALATLEAIVEDDLLERARGLGHRGLDHLKEIAARFPVFKEARGVGLAMALEIAGPPDEERSERIRYGCLERGLNVAIGDRRVIRLTPPLTIEVPEIERALRILEEVAADFR